MKKAAFALTILWLIIEGLLIATSIEQDGQAMPIGGLLFLLGLFAGTLFLPAFWAKAYKLANKWVFFAFLFSLLLVINLFWASCAHDNHGDPANWLNWHGFVAVCTGSVAFLSLLFWFLKEI